MAILAASIALVFAAAPGLRNESQESTRSPNTLPPSAQPTQPTPSAAQSQATPSDSTRTRVPTFDGIALIGNWPPEYVADVAAALEQLPPKLRRPPGGTLELALRPERMPFAMGDGSPERPDWVNGRRRFLVYAAGPEGESRASFRLERLTAAERAALWRRRAVVHAVIQRWEDALRLSARTGWKRITGWLGPLERPFTLSERPLNQYAWAYSRSRGMESAAMDLVTFAEELFIPAESVSEGAVPVDDSVRCQERSKARFLYTELAREGLLEEVPPRPNCPAFDAWAAIDDLEAIEVLLVAASGRAPESLMGHVMLRPVYRDRGRVRGQSFERVVQLVALTGPQDRGLSYALRGLTGGFSLVLLTVPMSDVVRQTLEIEQRTIRRFRLALNADERERLLERIWEMERRAYFPYYFFTENCASALLFLVNGALDETREVRRPGWFFMLPTAALDALADVEVEQRLPDGSTIRRPMLEPVHDDFESTRDAAARAAAERERLVDELAHKLDAREAIRWRRLHKSSRHAWPTVRRAAYEQLADHANRIAPSLDAPAREALYAYWAHTVRHERYLLERAEADAAEVEKNAVDPEALPPSAGADAANERQLLFQRESELAHRIAVLDRVYLDRAHIRSLPHRPYTEGERQVLTKAEESRRTFHRLTELHGALVDRHFDDVDPHTWIRSDQQARAELERAGAAKAVRRSGYARTVFEAGALTGSNGVQGIVTLRYAGYAEHLGELRLHGFQPSSELRALDGETSFLVGSMPEIHRSRFTVASYRTLRRESELVRDSLLDDLGWGFDASWDYLRTRRWENRAAVCAEALAVPFADAGFGTFAALGLGGTAQVRFSKLHGIAGAVGPRVSLSHRAHLFGLQANALVVEAVYAPAFAVGTESRWLHEAGATARIDLALPVGLLVSPRLRLDWNRESSEPAVSEWTIALSLELLR